MVTALKYTKIDYMLMKKQFIIMILFIAAGFYFSLNGENVLWGMGYIGFGAIILSVTPFNIQNRSDNGFIYMLPARNINRIAGRYFYSFSLCLLTLIMGMIILKISGNTSEINMIPFVFIIFAITIFITSIQSLFFYSIGNVNSRQLMSIISMIPAFIFYFIYNYLVRKIEINYVKLVEAVYNNLNILSYIITAAAIVIFIICIFISNKVDEKRRIK